MAIASTTPWLRALADEPTDERSIHFFETQIRPILADNCYACHSQTADKTRAGLRVDSLAGLMSGGDSGPAIEPGDPDSSLLIQAVQYDGFEMPPSGKLPQPSIEALRTWVSMGAPWPAASDDSNSGSLDRGEGPPPFDLNARKDSHWAWQPIVDPALPAINTTDWPTQPLDQFVLAPLEQNRLLPAPPIDRRGLIRRLAFDLTGLPPTIDEVDRFLNDNSPDAFSRLVDHFLVSPSFAERWARHWLDLVRYAETRGHEFDFDAPGAFQYRDYVTRAFQEDVPYGQFVIEQVAGDLLDPPRFSSGTEINESVLGTGFWHLGEWVHSPVDTRKDEADRFDNMIDVMSKTFLGMTVACARCHDHKFDAISARDYYALSGFLQGSHFRLVPFETIEAHRKMAGRLAAIDDAYDSRLQAVSPGRIDRDHPTSDGSDGTIETGQISDGGFRTLVNYACVRPDEYLQDGFIFGQRPRRRGEWVALRNGADGFFQMPFDAAMNDPFWDPVVNHVQTSPTSMGAFHPEAAAGRTLLTPTLELSSGHLFCLVAGAGQIFAVVDSHRLLAGPLHRETLVQVTPQDGDTVHGDDGCQWPARWVEMRIPRYIGNRVHLEFTPSPRWRFAVLKVVESASGAAPPPESFSRVVDSTRHAESVAPVLEQWCAERQRLAEEMPTRSALAMAMVDGTGEDDRILVRGNASNPGEVVARRFLEALDGPDPLQIDSGSGRLELANRLTDRSNPLLARVLVNRIWHHLMGRGIVATTDDFGVLGQSPTHPQLLDHLATYFLENGQSMKRLIRYIVLSSSYQMVDAVDPAAAAVDPSNSLWHHKPPRRLQAEVVRDTLLAVSGELDLTLYGPSIPVHVTDFMDGRGKPTAQGPLDGAGRRSIYLATRRNFLSPFLQAFDAPTPFSTMGRRNVSNVPAQALILMNDPLVAQLSEQWAARAIRERPDGVTQRLTWMFEAAFARPPHDHERALAENFLNSRAAEQSLGFNDPSIWADLAHVLINTKEFIFLR